ncbi:MAG TPA: sugar phosphate isomerase/epimerase [Candidatus Avipropionibacterium avicola]|uniref:Sugar phosphate isomerase/epimerase n=1 Tax=Candidatus Avipropionibacterium avicola TaxID=2840701 RepID=A0A9D1GV36_9ACTN|nr:sugar phosphate isomerase/epimerase [Candidatus Avipropionibacterium avicola]
MKFGLSSYSFNQRIRTGEMSILDVIDWVADSEAEHLEFAALSDEADAPIPNINTPSEQIDQIIQRAADKGVELSNLAVGANFFTSDAGEHRAEVERVKAYVDLAARFGMTRLRHDVVRHPGLEGDDTPAFEEAFGPIVAAAKEIAQYAATKGVTTSLENHGFFVQASDRVRRIIHAVDEPNFGTTLDIGNFLCVDEDPTVAVPANLPYATVVHFKDFYVRTEDPGEGWFRSRGGKYLRGAIVGNGDIDIRAICRAIKASGYDGFAAIEFEGQEDCLIGCARGVANAKSLFANA